MTEETKPTENTNEMPEAALADQLVQTVLNYGNADHKLKLSDAMGAMVFALFEIYYASRHAPQSPEQPAGGDKTEKDESQASA